MKKLFSLFLISVLLTPPLTYTQLSTNYDISNPAFAQFSNDVHDIGSYVVYGLEKVEIENNVTIQSGNVGIHDDFKKNSELKIKKDVEFVDSESAIVANKINIQKY